MPRFSPYLGVMLALAVGVFVSLFANTSRVAYAPVATSTPALVVASSTAPALEAAVSPVAPAATTSPTPAAPKASTTPPTKKTPLAPQPKVDAAPSVPATTTPAATVSTSSLQATTAPAPLVSSGDLSLDTTASDLRGAIVNILCYATTQSGLHSISGSGVFVDPKGIIITNAHVAQYFLLLDRGARCTIRTGSPAQDAYTAALIYISPLWVRNNASVITEAAPAGTGEYDFAFLAVTGSANGKPLPTSFPAVPFATTPPAAGAPVVIGTYGAQFLETNQVQSSLYPTLVFGSVKSVYTFKDNTIDVLALGGSAAAQEGSSGGGVATADGKLSGMITTSTVTGDTASRQLNAITASYIRAEYATEMGSAIDLLFNQDTTYSVADFAPQIPTLEALITANL